MTMAPRRGDSTPPNGNGNGNGHIDARRLVVPLWATVVVAGTMIGSATVVVALYYSLSFDLREIARSVNSVVTNAWTRGDQELFCARAQLQNKGWTCPSAGTAPAAEQVRPFPVSKTLSTTIIQPRGVREVQ